MKGLVALITVYYLKEKYLYNKKNFLFNMRMLQKIILLPPNLFRNTVSKAPYPLLIS